MTCVRTEEDSGLDHFLGRTDRSVIYVFLKGAKPTPCQFPGGPGVAMKAIDEYSEDRLEQVEQGVRRAKFDSQIRTIRIEGPVAIEKGPREADGQVDRLVGLMEVLAERITGLDRKTRSLTEDLRLRERGDRKRFLVAAVVFSLGLLVVAGIAVAGRSAAAPSSRATANDAALHAK
jgi:hypothetical protein